MNNNNCPICHSISCHHSRVNLIMGQYKIDLIKKSLQGTIKLLNALGVFLHTSKDMQYKLSTTIDDLKKCELNINDMSKWYAEQLEKEEL